MTEPPPSGSLTTVADALGLAASPEAETRLAAAVRQRLEDLADGSAADPPLLARSRDRRLSKSERAVLRRELAADAGPAQALQALDQLRRSEAASDSRLVLEQVLAPALGGARLGFDFNGVIELTRPAQQSDPRKKLGPALVARAAAQAGCPEAALDTLALLDSQPDDDAHLAALQLLLTSLRAAGVDPGFVVSKANRERSRTTEAWLQAHGLLGAEFPHVLFTPNNKDTLSAGQCATKGEAASKLGLAFFLDDDIRNLVEIAAYTEATAADGSGGGGGEGRPRPRQAGKGRHHHHAGKAASAAGVAAACAEARLPLTLFHFVPYVATTAAGRAMGDEMVVAGAGGDVAVVHVTSFLQVLARITHILRTHLGAVQ